MAALRMLLVSSILAASAAPAVAASSDQVREFAASIACSQLPLDACTWLDTENYANLRDAHKAQLRQKFCGTTNRELAKQMASSSEPMEFPNPDCTKALQRLQEF